MINILPYTSHNIYWALTVCPAGTGDPSISEQNRLKQNVKVCPQRT